MGYRNISQEMNKSRNWHWNLLCRMRALKCVALHLRLERSDGHVGFVACEDRVECVGDTMVCAMDGNPLLEIIQENEEFDLKSST